MSIDDDNINIPKSFYVPGAKDDIDPAVNAIYSNDEDLMIGIASKAESSKFIIEIFVKLSI